MLILTILALTGASAAFLLLSGFWQWAGGIVASVIGFFLVLNIIEVINLARRLRNSLEKLKNDLHIEIAGLWDRFITIKVIRNRYDIKDRQDIKTLTKMVGENFHVIVSGLGRSPDVYPSLILPREMRDKLTVDDFKALYAPIIEKIGEYNTTLKELKDLASNVWNWLLATSHPYIYIDDEYFRQEFTRIAQARR